MWRLWNKLFGWHYVSVNDSVHRVSSSAHGLTIWVYSVYLCRIDKDLMAREIKDKRVCHGIDVTDAKAIPYIPLTFKPEELIK